MVADGLLDPAELAALEQSEATLRRYRYALHLEAGRAEERLLFDYQRALAARLGFEDEHEKNLGVEQFMQGYYRAASQVERLGVQVAERFEEMLEPPRRGHRRSAPISCATANGWRRAIRSCSCAGRRRWWRFSSRGWISTGVVGFSADTMRRIHQATAVHGEALASDREALAAFLRLLRRGAPAVEALWRMNRHGLLAAILPAFGKVFGRMQYDLFHVYTVDEHTLRVLRNMARFADPAAQQRVPAGLRDLGRACPSPKCCCWPRCSTTSPRAAAAITRCWARRMRARSARGWVCRRAMSSGSPGWCAGIC